MKTLLFLLCLALGSHASLISFLDGSGKLLAERRLKWLMNERILAKSQSIDKLEVGSVRLMTYNVQDLKDMDGVLATVKKSEPSIVSLQEAPVSKLELFGDHMRSEGYIYTASCQTLRLGGFLANVIFSKHPITSTQSMKMRDPYGNRCVVQAVVEVSGQHILVFGTHLTNADGPYREQQMALINGLSDRQRPLFPNQAILGDFNDEKAKVQSIMGNQFTDSVDSAFSQDPLFSQWRGKRIDFVLLSKEMSQNSVVSNAVEVHSTGSDHIPIIADVKFKLGIPAAPTHRGQLLPDESDGRLPVAAGGAFIGGVAIGAFASIDV